MKSIRNVYVFILAGVLFFGNSCSRQEIFENKAPKANAGTDQIIYLPTNSVTLDGSGSSDQENEIISYEWRKISGPFAFSISSYSTVRATVVDLAVGTYQIELMVIDRGNLFAKDTMVIIVQPQFSPAPLPLCDNSARPAVSARLVPIGKLSSARMGMAVEAAGNLILFAGGIGSGVPGEWGSSRVDIYNISTKSWSSSELSYGRYGIAAVGTGNQIFFAGGQNGDGAFNTIYSIVDIYDVIQNTWSYKYLSEPRGFIAAAAIGDKVFFAGGEKDWDYNVSDKVDIYDLVTNRWSATALSQPRAYISAVSAGNKIYFAGGHSEDRWHGASSASIDIYDNLSNSWTWTELKSQMGFVAGVSSGDKVYWAEGCNVEIKDTKTGNSTISNLFRPGSWLSPYGQNLVVKNNKIIFYSSHFWDNNTALERSNKFDIFDTVTNTWSIGVVSQNLSYFSIISVNNTIYLAGGYHNGALSDQVWTLEF